MPDLNVARTIVRAAFEDADRRIQPWIWGPPGTGKSSLVKEEAARLGLPVIDLRGVTLEPTDVRGFPHIVDGRTEWTRPEFLPESGEGVLFLDELAQAPGIVQSALLQLTLDRCVGEHRLPDGWRIVAASNRTEDRAGVGRVNAALLDRFLHVELELAFETWREWAIANGVSEEILAFLAFRTELFSAFDAACVSSPTPRSWALASHVLSRCGDDPAVVRTALAGAVGDGAAVEFLGFREHARALPSIETLVADPDGIEIPQGPGELHALTSLVSCRARSGAGGEEAGALCRLAIRLPPEFGLIALRDLLLRHPEAVYGDESVRAFLSEHSSLLSDSEEEAA